MIYYYLAEWIEFIRQITRRLIDARVSVALRTHDAQSIALRRTTGSRIGGRMIGDRGLPAYDVTTLMVRNRRAGLTETYLPVSISL